MSASTPSTRRASLENQLLAQLGLPPSASPEDVDQAHLAVSQFLAAAPAGIRAWARVQAAALDEAYLQLTDPVGLEGSALSSPTRPPTVVPGGPATPPARRDPSPATHPNDSVKAADRAEKSQADAAGAASATAPVDADDTDTDDLDALYASVTPGAHRDMVSGGGAPRPSSKPATVQAATAAGTRARRTPRGAPPASPAIGAPAASSAGPWKLVAIGSSVVLVLVVLIGFVVPFVFSLGTPSALAANSAEPTASGPTVDMAQVTALMTQLQAKPNDVDTMMQLGNVYFAGSDYADAATFYGKVVAIDPTNVKALLANGAAAYNQNDTATAERLWKQVVALKPTDKALAQEVHYDLGVLYMHSTNPDWASVLNEWRQVIEIDPASDYASNVQQYAAALAGSSMVPASLAPELNRLASPLPAASGSASPASGSPAASASPAASGAAPSGSVAPSVQPSAAASPAPSASGSAAP